MLDAISQERAGSATFESTWINVTLFDRAADALTADHPERLTVDHTAVTGAAELLGLA